jgi:hypothetical protein
VVLGAYAAANLPDKKQDAQSLGGNTFCGTFTSNLVCHSCSTCPPLLFPISFSFDTYEHQDEMFDGWQHETVCWGMPKHERTKKT